MEPTLPSSIEENIADLIDGDKTIINSKLAELSDMDSEGLRLFSHAWTQIEQGRRQLIINRLVELCEDNAELNFDAIFTVCLNDEEAEVRSKAIEGLWENEEPSLIAPLISLLYEDSSVEVQEAAAIALSKFTMLAELGDLRPTYADTLMKALICALNEKDWTVKVQRRVLEAVAPFNQPQVRTSIIKAYNSNNTDLKTSAIYAMGKNCDPSWIPTLINELSSVNNEIRYEAAHACGEIGEEETVPPLMELIDDPDINIQLAAIQSLGKIGGAKAKNILEDCVKNPSSDVVSQAIEQALNQLEAEADPLSIKMRNV
ncbi:HEAT repeat domain-containing protein [Chloroflexota bacterium]